jgi:hypothetical protein
MHSAHDTTRWELRMSYGTGEGKKTEQPGYNKQTHTRS